MRRIASATLALALLIAGCGVPAGSTAPTVVPSPSASALPSLGPSPSTNPTWPPIGPAPSASQAGSVYLSLRQWADTGGTLQVLAILEDGRAIATRFDPPGTRITVRSLTADGVALVRRAVGGVGLFDRSQRRAILKPMDCCGAGVQADITTAGKTVSVSELAAPPDTYAPSAAWDRFDALVSRLMDLEGWLPAGAWGTADWQPFHAASYCLAIGIEPEYPGTSFDVADVTWPTGIQPFERFGKQAWEGAESRVGPISADLAYQLAAAIAAASASAGLANDGWLSVPLEQGGDFSSPLMIDATNARVVTITLVPMPPGFAPCG